MSDIDRRLATLETELEAVWLILRIAAQRSAGEEAVDWGDAIRDAARAARGTPIGECCETVFGHVQRAPAIGAWD